MADGSQITSSNEQYELALKTQRVLDPLESERRFWDEQAAAFAKGVSNNIFILNGGALVAIPSFAAISQNFVTAQYIFPIVCFIIGLIFSVRSNNFGFLACSERSMLASNAEHNSLHRLKQALPENPKDDSDDEKTAPKDNTLAHFDNFNKFRRMGFLCANWAMYSFIIGIILCAIVTL